MAVSAGSVLLATAGGILVYAGFVDRSPLDAVRLLGSGKPPSIPNKSSIDPTGLSGLSGGIASASATSGGGLSALPRACATFAGDLYSQPRRNQPGYSDCSSFVGKGLTLIGVKPPPGSTTPSYLASREWKRIQASDVQAGDLAVALNHMVVCYGNGNGIGQQNPRSNVQQGSVDELMYGNKPYVFLRYVSAHPDTPKSVMA